MSEVKLDLSDDVVFRLHKYMYDYNEYLAKIGENVQFKIEDHVATYFVDDRVIATADWHLIAECKDNVITWGYAHPEAEEGEQCKLICQLNGVFGSGLEVFNNRSVKYNDPMILNILMSELYHHDISKSAGVNMIAYHNSSTVDFSCILAFTNLKFL